LLISTTHCSLVLISDAERHPVERRQVKQQDAYAKAGDPLVRPLFTPLEIDLVISHFTDSCRSSSRYFQFTTQEMQQR
jgi:hypothetical protein